MYGSGARSNQEILLLLSVTVPLSWQYATSTFHWQAAPGESWKLSVFTSRGFGVVGRFAFPSNFRIPARWCRIEICANGAGAGEEVFAVLRDARVRQLSRGCADLLDARTGTRTGPDP